MSERIKTSRRTSPPNDSKLGATSELSRASRISPKSFRIIRNSWLGLNHRPAGRPNVLLRSLLTRKSPERTTDKMLCVWLIWYLSPIWQERHAIRLDKVCWYWSFNLFLYRWVRKFSSDPGLAGLSDESHETFLYPESPDVPHIG